MYTMLYMSATRTQIYLTQEQRDRLDELMQREDKSMAQIIREALDAYLTTFHPDPDKALESTFGSMPDLSVPPREEWERG
jgi:metal-responsive CopG/Arc/MetJ family transcriptional regulator